MPAYFKIDKEHKLVMSTWSGVVTRAEAFAHQENLRKHPDFGPSFSQLVDLSHVTRMEFTGEDVRRFALGTIFWPNSRRAILAPADLTFGLARMFEILRDTLGEKGIRVFRNLDDALEWVLDKNTDP